MSLTDDPFDPRLKRGPDDKPVPQNEVYLVLSAAERAKGFVRPVRCEYIHAQERGGCGAVTSMGLALSETYARDPKFYGSTYCVGCKRHRPVGVNGEFLWTADNAPVGS